MMMTPEINLLRKPVNLGRIVIGSRASMSAGENGKSVNELDGTNNNSPMGDGSGEVSHGDKTLPRQHKVPKKVEEEAIAVRAKEFYRFMQQGIGALKAHQQAEGVYRESLGRFEQLASTLPKQKKISESDQALCELTEQYRSSINEAINRNDFVDNYAKEFEGMQKSYMERRRHLMRKKTVNALNVTNYKKVFSMPLDNDNNKSFITGEETENLKERPLKFWREWDDRRTEILGQALGPRNLLEEQIVWTKKGMMWQYPIDNECMAEKEANDSFIDHVFLEPELAKYKLPSSRIVSQFMELVLVGLSKNPHLSVNQKREHIKWFSEYFKDAMDKKYKELL